MTRYCFGTLPYRILYVTCFLQILANFCKLHVAGTASPRHDRVEDTWATGRRMGEVGGEGLGAAGSDIPPPSLAPSGSSNDLSSRQSEEENTEVAALEPTGGTRIDLLTPPTTNQQVDTVDESSSDVNDPRVHSENVPDKSEPSPHSEPTCGSCRRPLKVYLYPLPRKFNFDLMDAFGGQGAGGEASRKVEWIEDIPEGLRHTVRMEHLLSYYLTADILNPRKVTWEKKHCRKNP